MPPYLAWGMPSQLQAPDGTLWRVLNFHWIQLGTLALESSFYFFDFLFGILVFEFSMSKHDSNSS